jgi:hypothetical protein
MDRNIERVRVAHVDGAALAQAAAIADLAAAPHLHYGFVNCRPRDVRAVIELREAIECERKLALIEGFDPTRLIVLQEELAHQPHEIAWENEFLNTVVTAGKNNLLDTYFAGSAYTAAWYLGLITNTGFSAIAAADTMSSHAGWTESQSYSNANRGTIAWAAASGGSKATSAAVAFNINATDTIYGAFCTTSNTKGGTSGTLYSAGAFSGGNRAVANGDTLNVSVTQAC